MLIKAGMIVLVGTLLGRLLGFIRETQIAAVFGAGQVAEAAIITLTLPDLLMNIFLGGAFSYAIIPEFIGLTGADARRLHTQMSMLMGLVFVIIALLIGQFSANILAIFNQHHLSVELTKQTQKAISISAWLMPLIALAGVTTAYLQANSRYLAGAFSTSIYNGALVVSLISLIGANLETQGLLILSLAMICGGLLRSLVLWLGTLQINALGKPEKARAWLVHTSLLKSYFFALIGGAALMMLPLVGRVFAGQYGEGALAQFNYASKLIELPLGVVITVISVVLLPALSQAFVSEQSEDGAGNVEEWHALLMRSLRLSLLLSLIIMLPCIWFASALVHMAFDWGKMDATSLAGIESLLEIGFLLLLVQGVISITSAALASARSTGTLVWSGLAGLLVFIVGGVLSNEYGQLKALMCAMVAAYSVVLILQCCTLSVRHQFRWSVFLFDRCLWYPVIAVLSVSVILAGIYSRFELNHWQGLVLVILSGLVMSFAVLMTSPEIKHVVITKLKR